MRNLKLFSFFIAILFLSSCGKKAQYITVIPQDADLVIAYNTKSIAQKGKLEKFTETNMFKVAYEAMKKEKPEIADKVKEIVKDPLITGINFLENVYMYFSYREKENQFFAVVGKMDNSKKYESFIEEMSKLAKEEIKIEDGKDYRFIKKSDVLMAWSKEKIVILSAINRKSRENLEAKMEKIFSAKKEDALISNSNFNEFLDNLGDFGMWVSTDFVEELPELKEMKSLINIDLKGNYLHAYCDFEDGAVVTKYNVTLNDDLKGKLADSKIFGDGSNNDLYKFVGANNYATYKLSMNIEEYVKMMLDQIPLAKMQKGKADDEIQDKLGMSIDEVLKSFDGDFLFTVNSIKFKEVERENYKEVRVFDETSGEYKETYELVTEMKMEPRPLMSFIANMTSDKLFGNLVKLIPDGIAEKTGDFYTAEIEGFTVYFGYLNKKLVITNEMSVIEAASADKAVAKSVVDSDKYGEFKDKISLLYLNLNYDSYEVSVKEAIEKEMGNKEKELFMAMIKIYDYFILKQTDTTKGEAVLKLRSKDDNSLHSIMQNIDDNLDKMMSM